MKRIGSLLVAALLAMSGTQAAAESVVVELFTSQGCSSCPPADEIFGELAQDNRIIALAYHVDYWDYLGWEDAFASPEHTARQRAYAHAKGERTIYTPQIVVGGVDHAVGSRAMKVAKLVQQHAQVNLPVTVQLQRKGDVLTIRASTEGAVPAAVVQVVTFTPKVTVDIRRGENAGKTLTYHNVVRSMRRAGTWDGQGSFNVSADVPGDMPVAVLVQAQGVGTILGAAQLR